MEAEKRRSEQARENANRRYKQKDSTIGNANRTANGTASCTAQSQTQSQIENIYAQQPSPKTTRAKKKPTLTLLPDGFAISDEVGKWAYKTVIIGSKKGWSSSKTKHSQKATAMRTGTQHSRMQSATIGRS
jgi:hypothetical protein